MCLYNYRTFNSGCPLRPRRTLDENWFVTHGIILIMKYVLYVILAVLR